MIPGLPTSASLQMSQTDQRQQKTDTSAQTATRFGSEGGLRSSVVTNFAMGGSSLEANTGDKPAIPVWAYLAAAGAVAGVAWYLYRRRGRGS